jgi:hypothetical protein
MWEELSRWLEEWTDQSDQWLDQLDQAAREIAEELRELLEVFIEPDLIDQDYPSYSDRFEDIDYWADFDDGDPFASEVFAVEDFRVSPFGLGAIVTYRSVAPPTGIGDPGCLYNARSAQLRCAVNPDGPCEGCKHFEVRPEGL